MLDDEHIALVGVAWLPPGEAPPPDDSVDGRLITSLTLWQVMHPDAIRGHREQLDKARPLARAISPQEALEGYAHKNQEWLEANGELGQALPKAGSATRSTH